MTPELFLITLLIIKHFICDFFFQTNWMVLNKGTYGHRAGFAHVGVHVLGTFWAFVIFMQIFEIFFNAGLFSGVLFAEAIIHYHLDWIKMRFNKKMGWTCNKSVEFWILMGLDQLLHYLTYVGMIWYLL